MSNQAKYPQPPTITSQNTAINELNKRKGEGNTVKRLLLKKLRHRKTVKPAATAKPKSR